ncbi:hypothetical protein ACIBF5_20970 [Micromonospora sp. NPDC050417]|uniref:hypothetical protein n=1 Tax=Micromonospora sp. NPDC050417 TaxID=3364280 RepID=UPI0037AF97D7
MEQHRADDRIDADNQFEYTSFHSAMLILLGLGLPVAVVLGLVYDIWWVLAVPVAVSMLMMLFRHSIRTAEERGRERGADLSR